MTTDVIHSDCLYPDVGQTTIFSKGHYLFDQFGHRYLACKPIDKPDDPTLADSLMELSGFTLYGKQFLQNLHPWKNETKVLSHLYCYMTRADVYCLYPNEPTLIPYLADKIARAELLIFPLDELKATDNTPTSDEQAELTLKSATQRSAKAASAKALEEEIKNAKPKPRSSISSAQILANKSNKATKTAKVHNPPAQSINEAETRLIAAKQAIVTALQQGKPLPLSSYTLADKIAVIENGLEENILVRVIETPHAGDDGTIGQVKGGRSITWTAPMSQVEHGDSDVALLLNAFGTRHDATKSYTLLLIDREKVGAAGDITSIIPTFDNLNAMIGDNPDIGISPALSKQVMNGDFAPKYEAFANQGWVAGVDMNNPRKRVDFAINLGHDPQTAKLLSARHQIAKDISAWEIFTGNGMTRDTNVKDKVAYGPVEVFSYDKNPQQLGKLEKLGALKRIPLD